MKAIVRRRLEMGKLALDFSRAHPEDTPGYAAVVARLDALLTRSNVLAAQQLDGVAESRTATEGKRALRRSLTQQHLNHLTRVARVAGAEAPELPQKFVLGPATSYFAFRTAARRMAVEAAENREVLVKYGLSDRMFDGLTKSLDQLDQEMDRSAAGRQAHVGAAVELDALASEIVEVVKVLDGLNRERFGAESELLGSWQSARNVVATPKPVQGGTAGTPPAEVKPAA